MTLQAKVSRVKMTIERFDRNQKVDAADLLDTLPLVRAIWLVVLAHVVRRNNMTKPIGQRKTKSSRKRAEHSSAAGFPDALLLPRAVHK